MRTFQRTLIILVSFLGVGCELDSQGYIPSDNPLVIVRFESMLSDANIEYMRNKDGFYVPTDPSEYERLMEIGKRALDVEPGRTSTVIQSKCAGNRLRAQLRDQKIYFVDEYVKGEPVITVSNSDAEKISLTELHASSEFDCR
jgi:hypothetical protein